MADRNDQLRNDEPADDAMTKEAFEAVITDWFARVERDRHAQRTAVGRKRAKELREAQAAGLAAENGWESD